MTKEKSFVDGDRYQFDWTLLDKGFFQVDSSEDASYYGHWLNPIRKILIAFIEGDLTITKYENNDEMIEDLGNLNDYQLRQSEGERGIKIDTGFKDENKDIFRSIGLGKYLYGV